ncbi:AfsR/SARP family transcriptional regulator [Streptacidiphilus sp. P02-A3a]|uniref:AfsR/SARP family transcriptional regulator n=1 Tax=Streptacidiphilus sp. P02-A3a TaxID=2704468 RepID=UPI0015FAD830|nr:AfsR/SARP family transcriptional regulator [Streptacidiphilus sp. P02-A3a]QMU68448.1 tetratricopeptide repeat protein [Streptacidiphilus sp. P02-A3a]
MAVTQDGVLLPISAPKPRAMLALLLLHANQVVSAAALEEALWEGKPPARATAALHNHVRRLRRALGEGAVDRIRQQSGGYLIDVLPGELDTEQFAALGADGRAAARAQEWARASENLTAALALWRGEPFADLPGIGQDVRDHLLESRLQFLEGRIEADLALGRHREVVSELRALVREQPLREVLHGQLMLALYRADRQAEALDAFRFLRGTLVDELGVEPSPPVQELHRRILNGDPDLAPAPAAAAPAPAPAPAPAAATAPRAPSTLAQLPADIGDFAGRQTIVDSLGKLLGAGAADGPVQPVVISAVTGIGGIGKTALAVHVGHHVVGDFPDGQLYVNLRGTGDSPQAPAEVLAGLLRDLGEPDAAVPPDEEGRAARFRSLTSGRRLLLVLDDARDAAQVRPLLPGSGTCAVVVTSRRRLPGLAGAVPLHLDVLTPPEALQLFTSVVGAERVDAEAAAVREVLGYCGGLPLAVRIAASRLASRPAWTVAALAARLADERRRLDELQVEDVAVRVSFRMSYRSLEHLEDPGALSPAQAFRLLGLVPGPDFTAPAAAALFGQSLYRTEDLLEILVDANLLEDPALGRYRFHDLLRAFAGELAADCDREQDRERAVSRLVNWYTHAAAAVGEQLVPGRPRWGLDAIPAVAPALTFPGRAQAVEWCRREQRNLAALVRLAGARGRDPAAWVLPAQLWEFCTQFGYWEEHRATHRIGLTTARNLEDPLAQSRMLTGMVHYCSHAERFPEAVDLAREAMDLAGQYGDPRLVAGALSNYGVALHFAGRPEESVVWNERALAAIRAADGAPFAVASGLLNIGVEYQNLHRYAEAFERFDTALKVTRESDLPYLEAFVLNAMGEAGRTVGDLPRAIELFQEAAALRARISDRDGQATSLTALGDTLHSAGQPDRAWAAWRAAQTILDELKSPRAEKLRAKLEASPAPGD